MGILRLLPAPLLLIVTIIFVVGLIVLIIKEYKNNKTMKMTKLLAWGFILLIGPVPFIVLVFEGFLKFNDFYLNAIIIMSYSMIFIGLILLMAELYVRGKTDERIKKGFFLLIVMFGFASLLILSVLIPKWLGG